MKSFCAYFNQGLCQSCDLIEMDYSSQIKHKEELLLKSLSSFFPFKLEQTILSSPTHFRNKAKFVVTGTTDHPLIGLYGEDQLDQGRELLACSLHQPKINKLIVLIKDFITLAGLVPYHIKDKKGELKGIIVFYSEESDECYLRFILRSKEALDRIRKYHLYLTQKSPHLKCLSVNIQPIPHAILEGEEEIFITELKSIQHKLSELTFSLGPQAFVQTNQEVAKSLYETAASWIQEAKTEKFIELFCGQGAFSFFAAPFIKKGLGIEMNPEAVASTQKMSQKYQFHHLSFITADAEKITSEVFNFSPDLILVNPPRRGLGDSLKLLFTIRPDTILYSSCNFKSLSKDLKKLKEIYSITRVQIFDMFPHTTHFETLVELKRKD